MARLSYIRKPCKQLYATASGLRPCPHGALRGKEYCARHRHYVPTSREPVNWSRQMDADQIAGFADTDFS